MIDKEDEVGRVVTTLKHLLRQRGMHYTDVAKQLSASERSVQRWFNGEGLTLDLLSRLCDIVGVTMAELHSLAENVVDQRPRSLTEVQEAALAEVPLRAFVFTRLLQGWTAQELQLACNIDEPALFQHLLKLERLGLIEVHPGNRVRLLTRRNIEWRRGGPMRVHFNQFVKKLVAAMDFGDAESIWTSEVINLSQRSAMALDAKLQALRLEIREMAKAERDLAADDKLWYSMVLLAYRHDPAFAGDPLGWALARTGDKLEEAPSAP